MTDWYDILREKGIDILVKELVHMASAIGVEW